MKLSAQNIVDALEERGYTVHSSIVTSKANLTGCRWLYSDAFVHGILYVEPPEGSSAGLKSMITVVTYGNDILRVESSSPEELFNAIQQTFHRFNDWERRLLACILYRRPLAELVQIADEVFCAPLIVDGIDGQSYGITRNYPPEIHPTWRLRLENDAASYDFVYRTANRPFAKRLRQSFYPMFNASEVWPGMTLYSNFYYNGRRAGFIVAYEYKWKLRPGYLHYMYIFARIVEQHIAQNPEKYCYTTYLEYFLFSVLFRNLENWDKLHAVFRYTRWQYEDPYCIYCVLPSLGAGEAEIRERREAAASRYQLDRSDLVCIVYENAMILLANLHSPQTEQTILTQLPRGFCAGRSMTFHDIRQTRSFYLQAADTARMAQQENLPLLRAEQRIARRITQTLQADEFSKSLIPDPLIRLAQYDSDNHTELLPTVHALVMCNLNHTDAAEYLHLHRNTLLQRVHRIQSVLGISPENLVDHYGYCSILLGCCLLCSDTPQN